MGGVRGVCPPDFLIAAVGVLLVVHADIVLPVQVDRLHVVPVRLPQFLNADAGGLVVGRGKQRRGDALLERGTVPAVRLLRPFQRLHGHFRPAAPLVHVGKPRKHLRIRAVQSLGLLQHVLRALKVGLVQKNLSLKDFERDVLRISRRRVSCDLSGRAAFPVSHEDFRIVAHGVRPARPCAERRLEFLRGVPVVAERHIAPREVEVQNRVVGVNLEAALVDGDALGVLLLERVNGREVIVGEHVVRIGVNHGLKAFDRVVVSAHGLVREAEVVVGLRVVRAGRKRLLKHFSRLVILLQTAVDSARAVERLKIVRRGGEDFLKIRKRLRVVAGLDVKPAQQSQKLRIFRLPGEQRFIQSGGKGEIPRDDRIARALQDKFLFFHVCSLL